MAVISKCRLTSAGSSSVRSASDWLLAAVVPLANPPGPLPARTFHMGWGNGAYGMGAMRVCDILGATRDRWRTYYVWWKQAGAS